MLILDLSNVVITKVQEYLAYEKDELSESMVRHITLSQILYFKKKFRNYGQVVLAVDTSNYWRKDVFKLYKQNRIKMRQKSTLDWNEFFRIFGIIKEEIRTNFPYVFVSLPRVEADDVIAVLTRRTSPHEPVMIVSADKDMIQIQNKCGKNVKQYSPKTKKFLTTSNTEYDLFTHYVKGDSGDGIPNILSDEDTFLCEDKRQKQVRAPFIKEMKERVNNESIFEHIMHDVDSDGDVIKKFKRNVRLIDIDFIPMDIQESIIDVYTDSKDNLVNNVYKYLMQHRMKILMQKVGEF